MPPTAETWKMFGDAHSKAILQAATNNNEYKNVTAQFHARLFLIVRGLSIDELQNMFSSALPPYMVDGDNAARLQASKIFEDSHTAIETQMVGRIRAYASEWLESEGGRNYREKYCLAK